LKPEINSLARLREYAWTNCPTTILLDPATDTDIISAQHFWTGGLETDAVAIARAAGFRMLIMSRIRHAAIVL